MCQSGPGTSNAMSVASHVLSQNNLGVLFIWTYPTLWPIGLIFCLTNGLLCCLYNWKTHSSLACSVCLHGSHCLFDLPELGSSYNFRSKDEWIVCLE